MANSFARILAARFFHEFSIPNLQILQFETFLPALAHHTAHNRIFAWIVAQSVFGWTTLEHAIDCGPK
jgi:hypothetical protein